MLFELSDYIFDIVFINQKVFVHNRIDRESPFRAEQNLLLVMEGDLGIRNEDRGKEGMGNHAVRAKYALYGKPDQ